MCPALAILSAASNVEVGPANWVDHLVLPYCLMHRRASPRHASSNMLSCCLHSLHVPQPIAFLATRLNPSGYVPLRCSWRQSICGFPIFLSCDGALITNYNHLSRTSLLLLGQQKSHRVHAGSDDHRVVRLKASSALLGTLNRRYMLRMPWFGQDTSFKGTTHGQAAKPISPSTIFDLRLLRQQSAGPSCTRPWQVTRGGLIS